jgi:hypothetical protein
VESIQLGKGALGVCLLGTGDCFFEARLLEWEGGVWFYHLPRGTMEFRMETQQAQSGGTFVSVPPKINTKK